MHDCFPLESMQVKWNNPTPICWYAHGPGTRYSQHQVFFLYKMGIRGIIFMDYNIKHIRTRIKSIIFIYLNTSTVQLVSIDYC